MHVKTNDLFDFMLSATRDMSTEYERIQKRATEDPGTAGDQGEENWATLFRDWLPPNFQVVTKGRILSHEGKASPQIDILILKPEYPRKLLDKKLYLAGGILAAFECKVTLKASHVREAVENASAIRKLLPVRIGSPYRELNSPIIYGLLAHSHSWKSEGSKPIEIIEKSLNEAGWLHTSHPRELLDIICVSDLATWVTSKMTYFGPCFNGWSEEIAGIYGSQGSTTTAYIQHSNQIEQQVEQFSPIGTAISYLIQKLGMENAGLRELADYYRLVNIGGSGRGNMRMWDTTTIFSEEIIGRILSGNLRNGAPWDEWSIAFI
jgi:hypothetical protein